MALAMRPFFACRPCIAASENRFGDLRHRINSVHRQSDGRDGTPPPSKPNRLNAARINPSEIDTDSARGSSTRAIRLVVAHADEPCAIRNPRN